MSYDKERPLRPAQNHTYFNEENIDKGKQKSPTKVKDLDDLLARIQQGNATLRSEITADVKTEIGKISDRLTTLEEKYVQLAENTTKYNEKTNKIQDSLDDIVDMQCKLKEQQDRINRSNNIVIMGIPENSMDINTLNEVMNIILPNHGLRLRSREMRVGKEARGKIRPIRVQLDSNNDVYRATENSKALKDMDRYSGIYARRDETKRQQEERKEYVQKKYGNKQKRALDTNTSETDMDTDSIPSSNKLLRLNTYESTTN